MLARPVAALTVAVLTLAACGGDDTAPASGAPAQEPADDSTPASTTPDAPDEAVTEPTANETSDAETTVAEGATPVDGPVATISPEVPEEYLAGIGPIDVAGDPLPVLPESGDDPAVGMPAPVLVGLDLDGEPIRIDPATDGPTMIVVVAHWCPHCNDEIPRLNELRDEGRFPDGLDIVALSTAARPDRPNWPPTTWLTDTMGWTYPAMLDGVDVERGLFLGSEAYGVSGFPFVLLVDGDGVVATRWSGEREPDEVISLIDGALDLG